MPSVPYPWQASQTREMATAGHDAYHSQDAMVQHEARATWVVVNTTGVHLKFCDN